MKSKKPQGFFLCPDYTPEGGISCVVRRFINEYEPLNTYYGNIYFRVTKDGAFTDFIGEFVPGDFTYGEW